MVAHFITALVSHAKHFAHMAAGVQHAKIIYPSVAGALALIAAGGLYVGHKYVKQARARHRERKAEEANVEETPLSKEDSKEKEDIKTLLERLNRLGKKDNWTVKYTAGVEKPFEFHLRDCYRLWLTREKAETFFDK